MEEPLSSADLSGGERTKHQLSSIDLLPEEADGLIDAAISELAKGKRTDIDILAEFNEGLKEIGLKPISESSFGRYAFAKRKSLAAIKATREVARAIARELGPDVSDDVTRMLAQMLKTAIHNNIIRGVTAPKHIKDMSQAITALDAALQKSGVEAAKFKEKRENEQAAVERSVGQLAEANPAIDGAKLLDVIRKVYTGEA